MINKKMKIKMIRTGQGNQNKFFFLQGIAEVI